MDKKTLLANLTEAAAWTKKQLATDVRTEAAWNAQNIAVGCVHAINQVGFSIEHWAGGRAGRLDQLRRIQVTYPTRRGNRALADLIDFARSTLEACCWREVFWVGALPIGKEPRRATEAQRRALQLGPQVASRTRTRLAPRRNGHLPAGGRNGAHPVEGSFTRLTG